MHLRPTSPTVIPCVEDRQDHHEVFSMWSRITSVSRRGFARIYGFLTGSRISGSLNEATRVPSQGALDPDGRQFSPPPPRPSLPLRPGEGGGCARESANTFQQRPKYADVGANLGQTITVRNATRLPIAKCLARTSVSPQTAVQLLSSNYR